MKQNNDFTFGVVCTLTAVILYIFVIALCR
jgi:hypothetical protein